MCRAFPCWPQRIRAKQRAGNLGGAAEDGGLHKAHEEQPPAAARALRFAAKNAPAGQRQIKTIPVKSVRAGHWDDCLPAPASASGSGKRRLREVHGQRGLWR